LALRCALIIGDEATLYAGGGLVRGATAEDELRETDLKLSSMLAILGGA
jgi:menaquinone-specific isochorismate synthase